MSEATEQVADAIADVAKGKHPWLNLLVTVAGFLAIGLLHSTNVSQSDLQPVENQLAQLSRQVSRLSVQVAVLTEDERLHETPKIVLGSGALASK